MTSCKSPLHQAQSWITQYYFNNINGEHHFNLSLKVNLYILSNLIVLFSLILSLVSTGGQHTHTHTHVLVRYCANTSKLEALLNALYVAGSAVLVNNTKFFFPDYHHTFILHAFYIHFVSLTRKKQQLLFCLCLIIWSEECRGVFFLFIHS